MTKLIRILLFPFSLLYGLVMALRNVLFNVGLLKSEQFDVPLLSIGNITVGGTGKTPHTEYVISLLKDDYKMAVLSRGYGRKTKGFVEVTEPSTPEQCGDEPCQMKRKFPQQLVVVDEDRRNGIKTLLDCYKPEVILMDDAYQHRWVKAGFSVLLVDYTRPLFQDFVMPTGNLREFPLGKKRADLIVVTKCPEGISDADKALFRRKLRLAIGQELYFSAFNYGELVPVFFEERDKDLDLIGAEVLLLSGIANPKPLENYLKNEGAKITGVSFVDHHQFSEKDIAKVMEAYELLSEERRCIITTEKDAVRLKAGLNIPAEMKERLYYVPIKVQILEREEDFNQQIKDYVAKN